MTLPATMECDALIVGAGPAGTSTAIWLARGGWRVVLAEQHAYPRRKVCGECLAAGSLGLLDDLGIGVEFQESAGPELRRIGWMDAHVAVDGDMPASAAGPYPYGRALGRERLDRLLVERAAAVGVRVLQPARVLAIDGDRDGDRDDARAGGGRSFRCSLSGGIGTVGAHVVIDAHGSWERGPARHCDALHATARRSPPRRDGDLFAFKANFRHARLAPGYLPVLAFRGGYGGMVIADDGRLTLACCIRRDVLRALRGAAAHAESPSQAGPAVEAYLRRCCGGVAAALQGAEREGAWLSVGPLQPGNRALRFDGVFRVGNALGESHPLIGEGISMALQSGALLAERLVRHPPALIHGACAERLQRSYAAAWQAKFGPRLRLAACYAHLAMRPALARPLRALLARWPALLCSGARLAGKAGPAAPPSRAAAELV